MTARIDRWKDKAGRDRMTLVRGQHRMIPVGKTESVVREQTVVIMPDEHALLVVEILADLGIIPTPELLERIRNGEPTLITEGDLDVV